MEIIMTFRSLCTIIREVSNDQVNYVKLIKKRIDGFLADPYVTNLGVTREGFLDKIERHPLPIFSTDVFIIFSKKSKLLNIVKDFNEGIKKVKQNGTYSQIINKYLKQ
jgi:polar amino acid transport system substrate-binding protein